MADFSSSIQALLQVPGMQQLLAQSVAENQQAMPLRTGIQQQALNMLPGSAFPGGRPTLSPTAVPNAVAAAPTGSSSSSGGPSLTSILPYLMAGTAGLKVLQALGLVPKLSSLASNALNGASNPNTFIGPTQAADPSVNNPIGPTLPFSGGGTGDAPIGSNDYNTLMNSGFAGQFNVGSGAASGDQGGGASGTGPRGKASNSAF